MAADEIVIPAPPRLFSSIVDGKATLPNITWLAAPSSFVPMTRSSNPSALDIADTVQILIVIRAIAGYLDVRIGQIHYICKRGAAKDDEALRYPWACPRIPSEGLECQVIETISVQVTSAACIETAVTRRSCNADARPQEIDSGCAQVV